MSLKQIGWLVVPSVLVLASCATSPGGFHAIYMDRSIQDGDWALAYGHAEEVLKSSDPTARDFVIKAIESNPELLEAGSKSFSLDELDVFAKRYESYGGSLSFQRKRADIFCLIATQEKCDEAKSNIDAVQAAIKPIMYVRSDLIQALTNNEKRTLHESYDLRILESKSIGLIVDRQSYDESTPGSSAGSVLGSAAGSATYVDRAFSGGPSNWNYSARQHLGAQAVGAIIGGALGDSQPSTQYRFRYTMQAYDGDLSYKDVTSSSPLGHSIGACVDISRMELISQDACELDPNGFRRKYLRE